VLFGRSLFYESAYERRDCEALADYGFFALVLFSSAFLLVLFLWQRHFAIRAVERALDWSRSVGRFCSGVRSIALADGIRSVGDLGLDDAFLSGTALYWGSNIVGLWLSARLAVCRSPWVTHGSDGSARNRNLLPTGPGLFGNFQLAISAALRLYFPESMVTSQGAVYIFIMYAIQLVSDRVGRYHPPLRNETELS